ncbi:glycosyl hydrolase [Flavobacterium sp.]|uniref:glycoside hydrolase family 26 protein n=1 Tax=Flavobacterium sp. TaxID=239 RepID=UPI0026382B91|nr:glycosyl hydrolase [Flavobacterium sp.]
MKKYSLIFTLILIGGLLSCSSSGDNDTQTDNPDPVTPTDPLTTANARSYMVDANATDETVALFYNLKKLSKTKFAIGQQDAFNGFYQNNTGDSDIKKTTGKDPALLGSDFMFITDKNNNGQPENWFQQQEVKITNDVKQAYSKGMINIFCWHLREPNHEDSFYAADMTADEKATAFKSILPGGNNHEWYKQKLDKVASVFNDLRDNSGKLIPVIFRPFHEFDGNWFWWGAGYCTPEEYKTAFQFTVDYLKNTKGVHNVLYAFSPDNSYSTATNYLSRYPGDGYVDVLGMDNYGDLANQGTAGVTRANNKLKMVCDLATTKVKIAALTETGYRVTASIPPVNGWFATDLYSVLTNQNLSVSFVMFWTNNQDGYYVPTPAASNAADFTVFCLKSKSALLDKLPAMYTLPQ